MVDSAQLIEQKIGIVLQLGERLDPETQGFRVVDQIARKRNDQG